jgi:hypothetical protein
MEDIILKTYKRDRDSDLTTSAIRVTEGMENNPNFPDPPPALAEMKKLLPEYSIAVANAKGRDTMMVSIKKDLKVKMVGFLTELDAYVTATCNGDRTMLISSGFYISGEKGEVPAPTIGKLDIELGPPGIITTRIKRVTGTRAYVHQYATEPPTSDTSWKSEVSLQANFTFSGLTSGKTYWLRVAVVSSTGQLVYSPVESRIIQ